MTATELGEVPASVAVASPVSDGGRRLFGR